MRWRLYVGLAVIAAASIAAVVIALLSATGSHEVERIGSALRLQTNCPHVTVRRPSRAAAVKRWAGLTVQSADVVCGTAGPHVIYAKFMDHDTLDRAVVSSPPSGGYCRLEAAIVLSRLDGVPSTVFSDMCQSLGGTLILASGGD